MIKNLPAIAGAIRDVGSIPGGGEDPLEKSIATHSNILAWSNPTITEEIGRL